VGNRGNYSALTEFWQALTNRVGRGVRSRKFRGPESSQPFADRSVRATV